MLMGLSICHISDISYFLHVMLGSRKVKVSDRDKMPYTYAVLHEVMRVTPVASLGLVHMATEDLVLGKLCIP